MGNDADMAAAAKLTPIFITREDTYSVENCDKSFNFHQTTTGAVIAVLDITFVKLAVQSFLAHPA